LAQQFNAGSWITATAIQGSRGIPYILTIAATAIHGSRGIPYILTIAATAIHGSRGIPYILYIKKARRAAGLS